MSNSGKQSPLGVNVAGSLLQNTGFYINPVAQGYMGVSKYNADYTPGSLINDTVLLPLTYAINDAYNRGQASGASPYTVDSVTYDALISIGEGIIPALGNSKSPYYLWGQTDDPIPVADPDQPATTGYYVTGNTDEGQEATWNPYDTTNPNVGVTQWGFLRLFPLQAWNEFNWNGKVNGDTGFSLMPDYKDFTASFLASKTFVDYNNQAINSVNNSFDFLDGVYSNMDDLISADVTGVSLSTKLFGQDCLNLGRAIDLSQLLNFGLPSTLLKTLKKNNAITPSLNLALLSAGLSVENIEKIVGNKQPATKEQEKQMYGAFLIIVGVDLEQILFILNCVTEGFESLADLLNVKKLFPTSYETLTVPIYNTEPGPTNSKTYYPIFVNGSVNNVISNPPPGKLNIPNSQTSIPSGIKSTNRLPGDYYASPGVLRDYLGRISGITELELYLRGIDPKFFPPELPEYIDPTFGPLYISEKVGPDGLPFTSEPAPNENEPGDPYGDRAGFPSTPTTPTESGDPFEIDGGNVEQPDTGRVDVGTIDTESNDRDLGYENVGTEYCPAPWIKITLSDMSTVEAKDINVGMLVYTMHETTKEWGNYPVTSKQTSTAERWKLVFKEGVEFVGTHNHRVYTEETWKEIKNLKTNDKVTTPNGYYTVDSVQYYDHGDVIKISVKDAHTYLTEGFLSHNVKNAGTDVNQSAGLGSGGGQPWEDILDQTNKG